VAQRAINDERLEDLLSRTALNLAAHAEQSAIACDGRVEHWHGVSLCDARSSHWYRNVATLTRRLRADESVELHRRSLDVPDGALVNHLSEELMYEPGGGAVQVRHPDLRIREAANGRDMEDFERVWASSYGHKHLLEPDAVRYDERVIGNGHHIFVGYVDDQAVTTAISYIHDGINLIRGVTTLPQYRGRGIASAMTAHAMSTTDLPRVLNAEPGVENIYRRLGFQTISTFSFWSSQSRVVTYG
jgi:predicted GNAT family acetyltransferase